MRIFIISRQVEYGDICRSEIVAAITPFHLNLCEANFLARTVGMFRMMREED